MNKRKVNVQMMEPQPTNGIRTIDTTSSQPIANAMLGEERQTRKQFCPACNALKNGVKSRKAFEHKGCEFDRHSIALKNHKGHATFIGEPSKELVDAVNAMADLAYTKLSKRKPLSNVTEADAKEIIKAGYPQFFMTGNWYLSDESVGVGEPCKKLYGRTKAFNFWFFDDKMDIDDCDDEKILTLDDVNYDVKLQCYIKAHQLGYYVKELSELVK